MSDVAGYEHYLRAKNAVEVFVEKELYPTDTPPFEVSVLAYSIGMPPEFPEWWGYFTTDLPDDMLYEVIILNSMSDLELKPYKKVDI